MLGVSSGRGDAWGPACGTGASDGGLLCSLCGSLAPDAASLWTEQQRCWHRSPIARESHARAQKLLAAEPAAQDSLQNTCLRSRTALPSPLLLPAKGDVVLFQLFFPDLFNIVQPLSGLDASRVPSLPKHRALPRRRCCLWGAGRVLPCRYSSTDNI